MKACGGGASSGIAPLILNLDTRRKMRCHLYAPTDLPLEAPNVPIEQETGWAPQSGSGRRGDDSIL